MAIQTRLLIWFLPLLLISIIIEILALYFTWYLDIIAPQNALNVIFISFVAIMSLASVCIYFISSHISKPVEELNKAAMEIASGNFGETIYVKGPREIHELAQTLNTMSQCLSEQMNRLKDTSTMRDRLYAEHECTTLLQEQVLQKAVDKFSHPNISMRLIKVTSPNKNFGCLLDIEEEEHKLSVVFAEGKERGFQGIYQLMSDRKELVEKEYPFSKAVFSFDQLELACSSEEMTLPVVWSSQKLDFQDMRKNSHSFQPGDFIFFSNQAFSEQFSRVDLMKNWYKKVLRHFGTENFESFSIVLRNELVFLSNKKHIADDLYILALKVNNR